MATRRGAIREGRLPPPQALAQLGTVLCLYRGRDGGELDGWSKAQRVACESVVDSDGLRESLLFFDRDDRCCWRLYVLPDTHFLAWEQLSAVLPTHPAAEHPPGIAQRLWRRIAQRDRWRANVMCLHALPPAPGFAALWVLAASPAPLSAPGATVARRIVRSQGIDGSGVIDDCCCRRAAARAAVAGDDAPIPLIGFRSREHA